jgi:hypothetical protein
MEDSMAKEWIVLIGTPDGEVDEIIIPSLDAKTADEAQTLAEFELFHPTYPKGTKVLEVYSSTNGVLDRESF